MVNRLGVVALVLVLIVASVLLFAVQGTPGAPAASRPAPAGSISQSAVTPTFWYNYSDFFNVPYGQWWDLRTNAKYGDEPIGASCFNVTSTTDGTCTTNVAGIPRVAQYPYMDWSGPGAATAIYAPYRVRVGGLNVPGYSLSQPVFLPVFNSTANAGNMLSFNLKMQYLNVADYAALTSSPLSCYAPSGANANDGYQLKTRIFLTLDNQEAARLFGAPNTGSQSAIQGWWGSRTNPACGGTKTAVGPLESSVNSWFQTVANGKYDIYNGYAGAYFSLYTNMTATVVSGGPTGTTNVYIEHGAWGTEALLDRWFYWGNATYAGNQADSSKAKGWWPMENGWWEGVNYAGALGAGSMNFTLNGVLQFHFQEHSLPGPDGTWHTADDTPYWTWGPQLLDYVAATTAHPNSELNRYAGLNYIKTTPGSGDYGTNSSFDYTPISWPAKTGETWKFVFPVGRATYYQNPATAALGTNLPATQLPAINSTLSLLKLFPAGYGTWNALTGTWTVTGGTPVSWPTGTPGSYPYIPFPGIYLQPGGLPPTVTTNAASGVTTNAATLNGNLAALGSGASVSVGFLWGTSPSLASATNVSLGTHAAGAFSSSLASLAPGTTYYFQAWALGDGFTKGLILSFTTTGTPPGVVTDAAGGITASAATLNGHTTSLGTAASVRVGFLWGTSPTLTGATNVSVTLQTVAAAFSSSLTSLAPGTPYYFQAWANGSGFVKGSIVSFRTISTPPTVVTDAATSVLTTTATLNGHTTGLGTAASVSVGFLYGTSATLSGAINVTIATQTVIGSFSSSRTGLLPGTTYYFQAWADGSGFVQGSILSFATGVTPPVVQTNAASGIVTTGATLNGATTSFGTAASVSVGFLYGTASNLAGAANATVTTQTAPGGFSLGLTGLTPGVTYYFQAWALGNGFVAGSVRSFITGISPPAVQTNAASVVMTSAATLNGATSSLGTASSASVGFLWGTSSTLLGALNQTVTTQSVAGPFSLSVSSLASGTTYYFQAWALGQGFATGSIVSFRTGVTPPIVQTNPATLVGTTSATLNGATTSLGTAASVGVGFLWGTSPTLTGANNVSATSQTVAGAFSAPVLGLGPGTTYYFQAWALGQGFATGSIVSFVAATTPPSVLTDAATGVTTTGAILNGHTISLGTAASASVGFLWGLNPTLVGATNASTATQTIAGAFNLALSSLAPGTTYYFQAWAKGQGFTAGSILSLTTGLAPPAVSTVAANGMTTTAATLNGNLASLGTASSVFVGFLWGASATLMSANNATVGAQSLAGPFSLGLVALTPGTTYYFRAWALGNGFASGSILSFTAGAAGPSVTTLPASTVTSMGATLNGAISNLGTAASVGVGFLWGASPTLSAANNQSAGTQTVAGAFSAALTGLTPGTTYYFEAWALGDGFATGSILSFTTPISPPVLCADLINRSAWAGIQRLVPTKGIAETLYGKVLNCGNLPVAVEVMFNVTNESGAFVGTFVTAVYPSLAPGWNVTLATTWSNPPVGRYIASAHVIYGAVGTTLVTPGQTVKSFKFMVVAPKNSALLLSPIALLGTPIMVILGGVLTSTPGAPRPARRARAHAAAATWLRRPRVSRTNEGAMPE